MATIDNTFVERAAAFITLANEQAQAAPVEQVGGSLLLATARYSAHIAAGSALSAEAMRLDRQAQIDLLMQDFRIMFEREYDFYIEKFDELVLGAKAG